MERPELPLDYEDSAWRRLRVAVHAIQKDHVLPESLEVLYQASPFDTISASFD